MRRLLGVVGVAILVATVGPSSAAAQQDLLSLPPLGFTIDPGEGLPGSVVNGQVTVADVNANCFTTAETIGENLSQGIPVLITQYVDAVHGGVAPDPATPEGGALTVFQLLGAAFGANLEGAADQVLEQSFVMTFADPLTQDLVGEFGNFSPASGIGSVVVPDVAPGIWAVAAACVEIMDDDNVGAAEALVGFSEAVSIVEAAIIAADLSLPVMLDDETTAFIAEIAPEALPSILTPRALGFQLYCVVDPGGTCTEGAAGSGGPAGPATAVRGNPRLTG